MRRLTVRLIGEWKALSWAVDVIFGGTLFQIKNAIWQWKHGRPWVRCVECPQWLSQDKATWFAGLCVDCWMVKHPNDIGPDDVPF